MRRLDRLIANRKSGQKGQILVMIALLAPMILGLGGLGVDLVLAYAVRAQLSVAIDSVALASMRALEQGATYSEQEAEVNRIANLMLKANFPVGSLLSDTVRFSDPPKIYGPGIPPGSGSVFVTDNSVPPGRRELRVTGEVILPTMFMRIFGRDSVTIRSSAVASRQDVNLILVLDRSRSLYNSGAWDDVQEAAKTFVNFFDNNADRLGLVSFGTSANVDFPIATGFRTNDAMENIISSMESKGGTNSGLGTWLAYGELLRVADPNSLNVIVFFTDGNPTAFVGEFNTRTFGSDPRCSSMTKLAVTQAVFSNGNPVDVATFNKLIAGPLPVNPGQSHDIEPVSGCWGFNNWIQSNVENVWDPVRGLPDDWSASYDSSMGCSGCSQTISRTFKLTDTAQANYGAYNGILDPLMFTNGSGGASRANKAIGAAKNLVVNVLRTAQADNSLGQGAVVYTIGLGNIDAPLMEHMANDPDSPRYDSTRPEGEFIPSPTPKDLQAAFQKVRSHVIRLTR